MPSLPFERRLTIFGGVDVVYCSVMVGLRGETPLVPPYIPGFVRKVNSKLAIVWSRFAETHCETGET